MKKENITSILLRLDLIKNTITENNLFKGGILLQHLICSLELENQEVDDDEDYEDEDEDDDEEDNNVYEEAFERELEKNAELRQENRDLSDVIEKLSLHLKLLIKKDHIFDFSETCNLLVSLGLGDRDFLINSRGKI